MSLANGDKARINKQQKRRRVRRAKLSLLRKATLRSKKAMALDSGVEREPQAEPRTV